MNVEKVRPLELKETLDGAVAWYCQFNCDRSAHYRVSGIEGGHNVVFSACKKCGDEFIRELKKDGAR